MLFDLTARPPPRSRHAIAAAKARGGPRYEALQPEYLFCDHERLPAHGRLRHGPWRWVIYEVTQLPLALELAARGADYIETMAVRELSDALRDLSGGS